MPGQQTKPECLFFSLNPSLIFFLTCDERQQLAELLEKIVRALEKKSSEYANHHG
jgi:hypothetical protein